MSVFNYLDRTGEKKLIELIKSELDKKYDKTGGQILGVPELHVDDEDYNVGVKLTARIDNNRGTILNMRGHADETAYYTVLEGIGTPVNSHDAATKQYVDDLCSVTFITGFYEQGELIVASDAYQKCFEGVTGNHSTYLKITEAGQVSVMRLQSWINFNDHSTHGDSFQFVGLTDEDTTKTATITYTGATFNTCDLEHLDRKISSWQSQVDNTHYPTEKLVKDTIDALKAYVDDKWGGHLIWSANSWTNGVGYSSGKARSLTDWKIQNVDFSPYKRVRAWISGCKGTVQDQEGASFAIDVFLDNTMISQRSGLYIGTSVGYAPNDNGVKQGACIVIDSTKTKCAMIYSNFNTTGTTALERDFKLVRLVGYKDDEVS